MCSYCRNTHTHISLHQALWPKHIVSCTQTKLYNYPPCQLAQQISCFAWFSAYSERKLKQCGKSYGCEWRRQATEGRREEEEGKCKQESKEQKRNEQIFHQMSSRPDDNGAAATCIITPRTTDCPAAQILHSRGQRESSHGAFEQDY